MESASEKEDVLTNPLLRDVLVANPQSAKSEDVLVLVENRTQPMPEYMKQQILNGQTIVGQKEQLEAALQNAKSEYANAINYTMFNYLMDTTINPLDSIKPLLFNSKNIESHYQLAGIYLEENDFANMNLVLNSIPAKFNLSDNEQLELSDVTSYYNMLATVYSEGRTIVDINTTEKQMIWDWYDNQSNVISVWSRNILVYLDELNYDLEVILPDNENKSTLINQAFEVNTPEDE